MARARAPKKPWIAALLALVLGGPGWFYLGWRRGVVATLAWLFALPLPRVGVVSALALGQDWNLEFAIMFLFLIHAGLAWLAFRSCKGVHTEAAKKAESPESQPYRATPEIPSKDTKGAAILSTPSKRRKQQLFADFDRAPFASDATSSAFPISRSAGKLLKGATAVHTLVPLVFLLPARIGPNIFSLTLMWYASVRIAQAWFFRDAGVLERTRWKRFWIGDLVTSVIVFSWMMGAVWFGDMPAPLRQRLTTSFSRSPWTYVIGLSATIYLVGLLGGFYNVKRWDKRDKEEILDCFQEWRLREGGQAS
jgi:hypothetical protein